MCYPFAKILYNVLLKISGKLDRGGNHPEGLFVKPECLIPVSVIAYCG